MELNLNSKNKSNILIVEDDLTCAFLAETALKNHYRTTIVTNGYDALQAIEQQTYNVILMDINLNDPSMDGLKIMRTIKFNRKHKNIKILAITASSDDKAWFLKQGFDGHQMKPLLEREIVPEIDRHIKPNVAVVKKTKLLDIA